MTSTQSRSGSPQKYRAVRADSFQSTLATSFQNSTLYLTMREPSFIEISVRLFSASPTGSWGPKLTSSSLMKTSKSHIQGAELVGSMRPGSNQLITGPSRYERMKRIFFSSSRKAWGRSRKWRLQATRKLRSFHGSDPLKVLGSQTLTFSGRGAGGGRWLAVMLCDN